MKPIDLFEDLQANRYPGRGIVLGMDKAGAHGVIAYFIMGRSVNSRNRVFEAQGDALRTKAFEPEKLTDPSLVIYFPVRVHGEQVIVTNGDQTDTIDQYLAQGKTFEDALRTRTFEPDPPIYTPRISGIMNAKDGGYKLSILKSTPAHPEAAQRQFFEYEPVAGQGHLIHTYLGDGDPVPSFEGEPVPVTIDGAIDDFTAALWASLNEDNKVSLFVRYIDLATGEAETRIVNKNQ